MRIPGRIERMQNEPLVLLDGAHNPQKMEALTSNLIRLAPVGPGGLRTAVFGALDSKNHLEMLNLLCPFVDRFIFTTPMVLGKRGSSPADLVIHAQTIGFAGEILEFGDPSTAIAAAMDISRPVDAVVVTGSMYLVGNARERWHKTEDIVVQRTPWPVNRDGSLRRGTRRDR